jgi:hypothetical protein
MLSRPFSFDVTGEVRAFWCALASHGRIAPCAWPTRPRRARRGAQDARPASATVPHFTCSSFDELLLLERFMLPEIETNDLIAHGTLSSLLARLGEDVSEVLADAGCHYVVLEPGQRFADVSAVLRRISAGVDSWPIPPAGLCIVEERKVVLRSISPMTVVHETCHLIDVTLGGGVYLSGIEPRIRRAFNAATAFCTPYAASACDEYMAECLRAWHGEFSNDPHSLWPKATRERLQQLDPTMYEIVREIFEVTIPERAAALRGHRKAAA